MTNYIKIAIVLCACVALSTAQFRYGHGFDSFYGTAFAAAGPNYDGLSAAAARDPRANRGPVVFPPSPAGDRQSSGVVVGGSGYGFVPASSGADAGPSLPRYFYQGFFLR